MKTLVLNSGSSSIKYQLLEMTSNTLLASGQVERIGAKESAIPTACLTLMYSIFILMIIMPAY